MNKIFLMPGFPQLFFAAVGDGAAAPAPDAGAAAPAPAAGVIAPALIAGAAAPAPDEGAGAAPKWWEGSTYSAEEQQWLVARGLTPDDPSEIIPKLIKGHRAAEQRLGKGVDTIIDKPAKDQTLADWLRGNAQTLGLPDKPEGYTIKQPEFWPKDAAWDTELEAQARQIAFDSGVPPEAHQAYVNLFAQKVKTMDDAASGQLAVATDALMTDLRRDFGEQTDAYITLAKQAFQAVADQAGLDAQALDRVAAVLGEKTGDAQVIRMFAKIGEMMGEDVAVQIGKGGSLTMTPADARAELARFNSPEGEYGKAFAAGNLAQLKALGPRREHLSKLAAR